MHYFSTEMQQKQKEVHLYRGLKQWSARRYEFCLQAIQLVVLKKLEMKKTLFILTVALAALTGCKKTGTDLDSADFTISSSAHSITLTIDSPVEVLWTTENGEDANVIEAVIGEDGKTLICEGDWFTSTVNPESPKEVTLSVETNDTGKSRQVSISVYHMGKAATTVITQKAK